MSSDPTLWITLIAIIGGVCFSALMVVLVIGVTFFAIRWIRNAYGGGGVQNGVSAPATITSMWDTGTTINNNPLVGFKLQVLPPGGTPFEAECKQMISRLQVGVLQPGAAVTVSYDPNNPKKIHITGQAQQAGPSVPGSPIQPQMDQAAVSQKLQQIDAANEVLRISGQPAQAQILRYTDWNVLVNGDNPAVTLQLQVMPAGKPQFMAETSGVIAAASISKYQPGCTIWVKYDPNNLTRVAIDHS